jgi:hypothetical protein
MTKQILILVFLLNLAVNAFGCNDSGSAECFDWHCSDDGEIPFPDGGVTATLEDICNAAEDSDSDGSQYVISHEAAQVSLTLTEENLSPSEYVCWGSIDIVEEIRQFVVGIPEIEIKRIAWAPFGFDSISNEYEMTYIVRDMKQANSGFDFFAEWEAGSPYSIKTTVRFDVSCPDSLIRKIESVTYIEWCSLGDYPDEEHDQENYIRSGHECWKCGYGSCA